MHKRKLVSLRSRRLMTNYLGIDTDWAMVVRCLHVAGCCHELAEELSKPRVRTSAVCCMLHVRVSAAHADGTPDAVSMCHDITATVLKFLYGFAMVNDKYVPRPKWVIQAHHSQDTKATRTLSRWLACC